MNEVAGYTGAATVIQGEHRVEVQCGFQVLEAAVGDMHQWRGWYKGAETGNEPGAGAAQLELPSGSAGTINITRAMTGTGEATFVGEGDPPAT